MTTLVILDFACGCCENAVSVTVQCTGKGLQRRQSVALVRVSCPHCDTVNQLYFEPNNGTVRDVILFDTPQQVLEPSAN